jgi:hypothetical protein
MMTHRACHPEPFGFARGKVREGAGLFFAALRVAVPMAALTAAPASGQLTSGELHLQRLLATPIGVLPPVAMPMPASRDRNYWGFRLQAGRHRREDLPDARAVAAGVDLQWRGGSVAGLTAGYESPQCTSTDVDCGGHALFGARAQVGLMSGGPTLAALIGDYSATTTLGTEIGVGYAPGVKGLRDACTVDVGVPVSISMLQRMRVVSFLSPGVAWDIGCLRGSPAPTAASFVIGYGLGIQQLWNRGLDVNVGLQQIFRSGTGIQFGISLMYVRLP